MRRIPVKENHGNGNLNGHTGATPMALVIKEWIAIGLAGLSLAFSAGGWYFKVSSIEKDIDDLRMDLRMNYVRQDVQGVTLQSIDRRLIGMETSMQKLEVKLDSVTVAVGTPRPVR